MTLAVDTNRYSDFVRGVADAVTVLEHATNVWVPFVALAELRGGFHHGSRRMENERVLQQFLARPGVGVLLPDEQTKHHPMPMFTPSCDGKGRRSRRTTGGLPHWSSNMT